MYRPNKPQILAAFRVRGLRCTPQRYAVLDCLKRQPMHPTAEQIYRAVNRSDPRASRATIYNNLHALTRAGLVREVNLEGKAARFDANIERHHHFVCEHCGLVEDIEWFDIPRVSGRSPLGPRVVRNYQLVIRGTCEVCSRKLRAEAKEKANGKGC